MLLGTPNNFCFECDLNLMQVQLLSRNIGYYLTLLLISRGAGLCKLLLPSSPQTLKPLSCRVKGTQAKLNSKEIELRQGQPQPVCF